VTSAPPTTGDTGYAVCLYDQGGRRLEAIAPAGRTCGTRPCNESFRKELGELPGDVADLLDQQLRAVLSL
jgi:hypothetical protein